MSHYANISITIRENTFIRQGGFNPEIVVMSFRVHLMSVLLAAGGFFFHTRGRPAFVSCVSSLDMQIVPSLGGALTALPPSGCRQYAACRRSLARSERNSTISTHFLRINLISSSASSSP